MGTEGSTKTVPVLYEYDATTALDPVGVMTYARGARSCADIDHVHASRAVSNAPGKALFETLAA
jgi:hypothetical protein